MGDTQVLLGTSSWTADGWVGRFYADHCKPQNFLPRYAEHFNTVEIDSTFYRIPSARTAEQWKERTPEGCIFAAKVPQIITHEKVLADAEDDLKTFLKVMEILGDKLGPLLLQFPYFNKQKFRDVGLFLERLELFLKRLPKDHQWVVEVRNKNWLSAKLYTVRRRHGVALALVDHAWMPRPPEVLEIGDPIPASFTFSRWIGDRKGIEEQTKVWNRTIIDRTEDLRDWVEVIKGLTRRVKLIFALANNHYAGYAPETIELFRKLWSAGHAAT
jgi:uncharacterized protein YecE (DUF72 family)